MWVADWYCTDYPAAGLALCETLAKRVDAIARENAAADNGSAATSGDDAQDDDAREAARKEELRQERRKVIALNKLGEAAEAVRRTWIREKLRSRKTAPKGGARFVAQCLTRDIRLVEEYHGSGIAAELLGLGDSAAMNTHARELGVNADGRAQVVTLALVLGALEARAAKDAWRYGGRGDKWCGPVDLLQFLRANGYELADVERIVTGELDSDAVFTRLIKQDLVPKESDELAS